MTVQSDQIQVPVEEGNEQQKNISKARGMFVWYCVINIVVTVAICGLVFLYLSRFQTISVSGVSVGLKSVTEFVYPVLGIVGICLVSFLAFSYYSFRRYLYHKIYLPEFRLSQEADQIAKGDFSRKIDWDNDDSLQTLADTMDLMTHSLRDKHIEIQNRYNRIKNFLDEKRFEVTDENREQLKLKLKDLNDLLREFKLN